MLSELRRALRRGQNGVIEQKRLAVMVFVWNAVCICWGILSFNKTYQFYHVSISTADFLILLQNSWNFGIMILPFTVFLVMRCKQDSLNVQRLLRYGSRSKMLGIQFMESAIYAIYHALAVVLIESIAAYSLTGVWINWNEIGSLFYSQTGAVADAGFLGVAITVGMLYFLKYMIVFGFWDLLFWNPRYMFTVWILLIVLAGTDRLGNTGFYQIFSVSFGGWNSPRSIFTLILGGIVIIGTEYLAGVVKIRKQDIF